MHNETTWSENVILADADYIDKVAFHLICNFERMIDRRIPEADMSRWVECVALDGGLREGDHETSVILVHEQAQQQLKNFTPSAYAAELNGQAFKGRLGEFVFNSVATEDMAPKEQLFMDTLSFVASQKDVRRLMVIPDERYYDQMASTLRRMDDDEKRITVFAMQPMPGGQFRQEILGYSLMSALGIRADEIK